MRKKYVIFLSLLMSAGIITGCGVSGEKIKDYTASQLENLNSNLDSNSTISPDDERFYYGTWTVDSVTDGTNTITITEIISNGDPQNVSTMKLVLNSSGEAYLSDSTNIVGPEIWKFENDIITIGSEICKIQDGKIMLPDGGSQSYVIFNKESDTEDISIDDGFNANTEKRNSNNTSEENSTTSEGLRPDFKKAMDDYEAFYDEYCSYMKKYNTNPTDMNLLMGYASMLSKYNDMCSSFEKWESQDLNDVETRYYIEVQARCIEKMSSIY